MFNISSMIIALYLCLFQTKIPCQCSTYHLWSSFFMFLSYRDKNRVRMFDRWWCQTYYRVFNVWHIIIPSFFMFVYARHKYNVFNVQHIIYDHSSSCLCFPEFMFSSLWWYASSYHLWPSFSMLMHWRDKFVVLNVRHINYNHRNLCLCSPEINAVFIIFDKSSILVVVYVFCRQQFHIIYHPWSSHLKFVFSRVKYRVFIVLHIIYDYHCLCVSSTVTYIVLLFDISSMTFLLYVCVF